MTPSDETIAAYLALPLEARRMLAEKADPAALGWWVGPSVAGSPRPVPAGSLGTLPFNTAWIPAAPSEVMRVWASTYAEAADFAVSNQFVAVGVSAADHPARQVDHDGTLDGMLRAAALCFPVGA